jgi:hypothetical protein
LGKQNLNVAKAVNTSQRRSQAEPTDSTRAAFVLIALLGSARLLHGTDLIPLATHNQWTLKSFFKKEPITIVVDSLQAFGPEQIASVQVASSVIGTYTLLLDTEADGIYVDGFLEGGVTHLFPSALPYFLFNVSIGASWTSPFGKVTLTDSDLTTTSLKGVTYKHCYRYVITQTDGSQLIWVLKPGVGFIRFGEGPSEYTVVSYSLSGDARASQESPNYGACAMVGLSSIPTGPSITDSNREAAILTAIQANATMLKVEATWQEVEPQPGVFDFSRIQSEMALGSKYNLPIVLTVKTIDTTLISIPADLLAEPLDSEDVITRFKAMLTALIPLLPPQVHWIHLGYELDFFLAFHPETIASFETLYSSGYQTVKSFGDYSVGLVFQFDDTRISNSILNSLLPIVDHVSFNYYGHSEGFSERDASVPLVDIPYMIWVANSKPIIITELGYSSSTFIKGGLDQQAEFLQNAFDAIRVAGTQILGVNVWSIRDLPASYVDALTA